MAKGFCAEHVVVTVIFFCIFSAILINQVSGDHHGTLSERCQNGETCYEPQVCCGAYPTGCCTPWQTSAATSGEGGTNGVQHNQNTIFYDERHDHHHSYSGMYRLSFWNMWYFWFIMLVILLSCFGGCGYYRRQGLQGQASFPLYAYLDRRNFSRQRSTGRRSLFFGQTYEHRPTAASPPHQQQQPSYVPGPPPYSQVSKMEEKLAGEKDGQLPPPPSYDVLFASNLQEIENVRCDEGSAEAAGLAMPTLAEGEMESNPQHAPVHNQGGSTSPLSDGGAGNVELAGGVQAVASDQPSTASSAHPPSASTNSNIPATTLV